MTLGDFLTPDLLTDRVALEEMETTLEGKVESLFYVSCAKCCSGSPAKRSSANELAEDEWIHSHM